MESFRGFEDEAALHAAPEEEPGVEYPPDIGLDERRMHVRAYNHRSPCSTAALTRRSTTSTRTRSRISAATACCSTSREGSATRTPIQFLGRELREECALEQDSRFISEVPARSCCPA